MNVIFKKIIGFADEISTRPNFSSWKWRGKPSPLSFFVVYLIYFIRICSLLQISKFLYRKLASKKSIDYNSQRVNVPPIFVELYFIIWAIVLFVLPKGCFTKWLSYYFLFESFFWLLYYFFFRRFYEERYAIMHILEYIILLPLIILIQARSISIISNHSIRYSLGAMFFPDKGDCWLFLVLSVIYTALIFGIFLSYLPIENVKEKSNYRYHISIIGFGFIVKERLLKAINKYDAPQKVAIYDLTFIESKKSSLDKVKIHYFPISDETTKHILSSNILWIATPSYAHFSYLKEYINRVFVVIEKPLVIDESEIGFIKQLRNNGLWSRVFCLSYYYLEKDLPLTYLYSPLSFYEKYLNFTKNNQETDKKDVLSIFEQFGKLKEIKLILFEGEDNRAWLNNPQYGGHLFETFIHLAVLARTAMGENTDWGTPKWTIDSIECYRSHIKCEGVTKETYVKYNLEMKKFCPENKRERGGEFLFENGNIKIDFEKQKVDGTLNNTNSSFSIQTKDKYETKYSIQLDMVKRCYEENVIPFLIDGSEIQIKTLEWLFAQKPFMP